MGLLKNVVKSVKKVANKVVAVIPGVKATGQAIENIAKKGVGALDINEITGKNRANLLQKRTDAAAGVNANPAGVDPNDLRPGDMPTIDSAVVEEARKKIALLAAARGGRASTMLTDKTY